MKILSALALIVLITIAVVVLLAVFPFMGLALVGLYALPPTRFWAGRKAYHLWIAFDKFGNAMRFHDHRETISSCLGKSIYYNHPPVFNWRAIDRAIAGMLDHVDPGHCRNSIDWTVGRDRYWQHRALELP